MNRVVNIFSFFLLGVFCLTMMVVVLDLSISTWNLKGMPYQREVFTGIALLLFLLGLIRIQRRWQGMRDMKRYKSFVFKAPLAKKHRNMGVLLTTLEAVFYLAGIGVCAIFLRLEPTYVYPMILVLAILSLESILFIFVQLKAGPAFMIGFDDHVIAYFDREIHLFYYSGLQRVELYQKDLINLGYRDELNLGLETTALEEVDRKAFRDAFIQTLESKNIYVEDSLRNWQ